MIVALLATLALTLPAWSVPADSLMQRLIADAWRPSDVRVQWSFAGAIPQQLQAAGDWQLDDPLPARPSGAVNLRLRRTMPDRHPEQVRVSGQARIFGMSLTAKSRVLAGQGLDSANSVCEELEWTRLSSPALIVQPEQNGIVAVRSLVQGRVITQADVRAVPTVRRGQQVSLEYRNGSVRVRMIGRALHDGSVGETIPVAVDLGREKRHKGIVQSDGHVELVL